MELGKKSTYESLYNPDRLFAIPREIKRNELGITAALPFSGFDIWNHYEVSWLNQKGLPQVAMAELHIPCDSPNLIESKSMKLYFNTLNNTRYDSLAAVQETIAADLSECAGAPVLVKLDRVDGAEVPGMKALSGESLDHQDIEINTFEVTSATLQTVGGRVAETVYSNLLKSNCLVTGQPDWGTVSVSYEGEKICREGLLRYIVSFRNHEEFHEQCVERIFLDISRRCAPDRLTVSARYTRRGGIDINPIRSSEPIAVVLNERLVRQ
ncbi:NADPH-dependent 7-cyano-7-deazaguanine reductase QueF [Paraburkholderia bonniea]|uniref:NADPH-dependent 7-cyano-7-deazaguanine reductase QueF n=1 Tax=Paraburkholderia bonniea TaxID=2152891 RepID=UPI00129143AE|nr:NADPH-dependent 7-cyano-7-deazaguanine reductase QueF [Paraburkholderia bonniea]WJF90987.1 NADPH-dependent 7-cyano-7-deazaguanine reductase QueF [Paraburkholderia bonniea]WJF94301.1 NADPH-dependent 7-cyano-7-deazaguanine reductase QueF [Paraburkholderia bonniea]